jgi:hypothetical protein
VTTALKDARTALAAKITAATAAFVVTVLDFDPPAVSSGDTITVSTAGVSPTDWRLFVRVYVSAIQSSEGQDRLDDLVEACETVGAGLGSTVPRSAWEFVYDESKDAFLMLTTVDYPREDWG